MSYKDVKKLIQGCELDEALEICSLKRQQDLISEIECYRLRANIYGKHGKYNQALAEWSSLLLSSGAELRDYYLAADDALSAKEYVLAEAWLKRLLEKSEIENEPWFDSSALFFLVYIKIKQREHEEAIQYLERLVAIAPDCEVAIPNEGFMSVADLKKKCEEARRTGPQ